MLLAAPLLSQMSDLAADLQAIMDEATRMTTAARGAMAAAQFTSSDSDIGIAAVGKWISMPGPLAACPARVVDFTPDSQQHLVLVAQGQPGSHTTHAAWVCLPLLGHLAANPGPPGLGWHHSKARPDKECRLPTPTTPLSQPHMHSVTVPGSAGTLLALTAAQGSQTAGQTHAAAQAEAVGATLSTGSVQCDTTGDTIPPQAAACCLGCGTWRRRDCIPSHGWAGPPNVLRAGGPAPSLTTDCSAVRVTDTAAAAGSLAVPPMLAVRRRTESVLEAPLPQGLPPIRPPPLTKLDTLGLAPGDMPRLQAVAARLHHLPPTQPAHDEWLCSGCCRCDTCGASEPGRADQAWQCALLAPPGVTTGPPTDDSSLTGWTLVLPALPAEPPVLRPRWAVQCSGCLEARRASPQLTCSLSGQLVSSSSVLAGGGDQPTTRVCSCCQHPVMQQYESPPPLLWGGKGHMSQYVCMACRASLARQLWCVMVTADRGRLFYHPVTTDMAPGYFAVVQHPMDLLSMKAYLVKGGYHLPWDGLQTLRDHAALVARNALIFNEPTGRVFRDATRWFRSVSLACDAMAPWTSGDAYADEIVGRLQAAKEAKSRSLPRLPRSVAEGAMGVPVPRADTKARQAALEAIIAKARAEAAAGTGGGGQTPTPGTPMGMPGGAPGGEASPSRLPRARERGAGGDSGAPSGDPPADGLPVSMGLPHEYRVLPRAKHGHAPNALPLMPLAHMSSREAMALSTRDMCAACGSSGDAAHMLCCVDCGETLHCYCLALDDDARADVVVKTAWRCPNCKVCEATGHASASSDSEMLYCERCDGGYAMSSLRPSMSSVPSGRWVCAACVDAVHAAPDPCQWVVLPSEVSLLNCRSMHLTGTGNGEALGVDPLAVAQASSTDMSVSASLVACAAVVESLMRPRDMALTVAELGALQEVLGEVDAAYRAVHLPAMQASGANTQLTQAQNMVPALVQRGIMADYVAHRVQETYLHWARSTSVAVQPHMVDGKFAEAVATTAGGGSTPDASTAESAVCTDVEHTPCTSRWGDIAKVEGCCPLCLKEWGEGDSNMAQCDLCHTWVHGQCEAPPITPLITQALEAVGDGVVYLCAGCRAGQEHTFSPSQAATVAPAALAKLAAKPEGLQLLQHPGFALRADLVTLLPAAVATARARADATAREASAHSAQLQKLQSIVASKTAEQQAQLGQLPGKVQELLQQAPGRVQAAREAALTAAQLKDPAAETQRILRDELWAVLVALQDAAQQRALSASTRPQHGDTLGSLPPLPLLDAEPWWIRRLLCGDVAGSWAPRALNPALAATAQAVMWQPPHPVTHACLPAEALTPQQRATAENVLRPFRASDSAAAVWQRGGAVAPNVAVALSALLMGSALVDAAALGALADSLLAASPASPGPQSPLPSPSAGDAGLAFLSTETPTKPRLLQALSIAASAKALLGPGPTPLPPYTIACGAPLLACLPPLLPSTPKADSRLQRGCSGVEATQAVFDLDPRACGYCAAPESICAYRFDILAALDAVRRHGCGVGDPEDLVAVSLGVGRGNKTRYENMRVEAARLATPACCVELLQGLEGRLLPVPHSSTWVSAMSAVWSSDVVVGPGDASLYGVQASLKRALKMRCSACGLPGASIACCRKGCGASYHLRCAVRSGAVLDPLARGLFCTHPKCLPEELPDLPQLAMLPAHLRAVTSPQQLKALATTPLSAGHITLPAEWLPHLASTGVPPATILHLPMSLARTWHATLAIWSWPTSVPFTVSATGLGEERTQSPYPMTPGGVPLATSLSAVRPLARGPPLREDLLAGDALQATLPASAEEEGGALQAAPAKRAAVEAPGTGAPTHPALTGRDTGVPTKSAAFDAQLAEEVGVAKLRVAQAFLLERHAGVREAGAEVSAVIEALPAATRTALDAVSAPPPGSAGFSILDAEEAAAASEGAASGPRSAGRGWVVEGTDEGDAEPLAEAAAEPVPCLRIGALTVLRWGRIIPHSPGFHTEKALYPVGYLARRVYWAPGPTPGRRCSYTLDIQEEVQGGDGQGGRRKRSRAGHAVPLSAVSDRFCTSKPVFRIRCDADPTLVIRASSPDAAFRALRHTLSLPHTDVFQESKEGGGRAGLGAPHHLWQPELAHPHGGCMPHLYGPTWQRTVAWQCRHFGGVSPLQVACIGSRFAPQPRAVWGSAYGTSGGDFFGITLPHVQAVLESAADTALAMVVPVQGHTTPIAWPRYQYRYLDPPTEFASMARIHRDEAAAAAAQNTSGAARCEALVPPPPLEELLRDPHAYLHKQQLTRRAGVLAARMDNLDHVPGASDAMLCFPPHVGDSSGEGQVAGHAAGGTAMVSRGRGRGSTSGTATAAANVAATEDEESTALSADKRPWRLDLVSLYHEYAAVDTALNLAVRRSPIHGWGLFARRDIPKDTVVIEYTGAILRQRTADFREHVYNTQFGMDGSCYLFRVDDDTIIDATLEGGPARFINHCCDPNCYSRIASVAGGKRILILAKRTLRRGEEITYDYKFPYEPDPLPCYCGAEKCRGRMN